MKNHKSDCATHAKYTSELGRMVNFDYACDCGAIIWSEVARELSNALTNLFAMVEGEVPSLLEDHHQYDQVVEALAMYKRARSRQ